VKVLHVIEGVDRSLGGLPYALFNILHIEQSLGVESEVLSIMPPEGMFDSKLFSQPFHLFDSSFPKRFKKSQQAIKWLKEHIEEFDLITIHGIWNLLVWEAAFLAAKKQKSYIIWPHGSLDPFDLQKKRYLKKMLGPILVKSILNNAACVCCTAQLEAEVLEKYRATPLVTILPLVVVNDVKKGDRNLFRKTFKFSDTDFVVLFLSRIDYKKGLNLLLPALSKLKTTYPHLKLAIAGADSNNYLQKVKTWIEELQLEDRVIFCGLVSGQEKADAFAGSNCFVLPSMNENFGIAIVESLQAGLPVLISKNVYIWREIVEKEGGWACEYSIESVAFHLKNILDNPRELLLKRENASRAGQQFSFDSLSQVYFQFYQSFQDLKKPVAK
jgi:glycosyltransferase involved in cell wall biosynthesis